MLFVIDEEEEDDDCGCYELCVVVITLLLLLDCKDSIIGGASYFLSEDLYSICCELLFIVVLGKELINWLTDEFFIVLL